MDAKDYASIGGFLFTIYRYFYPKNLIKHDLSFVKEKEINISTEEFKAFSKLQILYDNQSIENIKLIEFSFRNTGNIDITSEMLRGQIIIDFPDDFVLLEAEIQDISNNSKSRLISDSKKLSIIWDLLKPEESIIIKSLLHLNPTTDVLKYPKEDFFERIDLKYRITGIDSIGKFYKSELTTQKKTKSDYKIEAYINLFFAGLFILQLPIISHWIFGFFSDYPSISFEWRTGDIIFTILFILLSLLQILAAAFAFHSAKKFK